MVSIGFWNPHTQKWLRCIALAPQFLLQRFEPSVHTADSIPSKSTPSPPVRRHWPGCAETLLGAHPLCRPCPTSCRIDNSVRTWLSPVMSSAASQRFYAKLIGSRQSPRLSPLCSPLMRQGPFPPPELPGFHGTCDPVRLPSGPSPSRRRGRYPRHDGSPPMTRITFLTCHAHYPGEPNGCSRRLLPRPCSLPRYAGGSAFAPSLSRPARASLALRPVRLLGRPRRPLSRGSGPASYPAKPLVSYQTYRHLSGWILPPLVIRAFGAHCIIRANSRQKSPKTKRNAKPINVLAGWGGRSLT